VFANSIPAMPRRFWGRPALLLSLLEQFKKFCSHRYVAAKAVAPGFELGQYVSIQALRSKPERTSPRRRQISGYRIF